MRRAPRRRAALSVTLAAAVLATGVGATGATEYHPDASWGTSGGGDGQFSAPTGIAVEPGGTVLVGDAAPGLRRLQRFTADGALVGGVGGPGVLQDPRGLGIDDAGSVYVADGAADRIVKLGPDGAIITSWGSPGTGEGQFRIPVGLAVDGAGRVYVLDAGGAVQQFTSDGAFLARWAAPAAGPGSAPSRPADLAVAPNGDVLVLDGGSGVVTVRDPSGALVTAFGGRGTGPGQTVDAAGIAIGANGEVFVADAGNQRIEELTSEGAFVAAIGDGGLLARPVDVAVGHDGALFVVDAGAGRVQRFGDPSVASPAGTDAGPILGDITGKVLARAPGGRRFAPVKGRLTLATGWVIDARHGSVTLRAGASTSARLRAGIVTVRLRRASAVELALSGGTFARCTRRPRDRSVIRRVSVSVTGTMSIRGRDSVATTSGGTFTVADACRGTTTRVLRGRVRVASSRSTTAVKVAPGASRLAPHRQTS